MAARLADLSVAIGIAARPGWNRIFVRELCEDSRRVRPGALFVAVPGAIHDGADFVLDAVAAGAVAVVSETDCDVHVPLLQVESARASMARLAAAFYGRPTEGLFTVGVTGTNGKTTVCHWIGHLLGADRTAIISTVVNQARGLLAVTTPSSLIVQRIAAEARCSGAESLIIEASSIGLELRRVDAIDFDVGVFTNLTHDHLDLHGTMDAYLQAKRILFRGLKKEANAVVNVDDPASEAILDGCRATKRGFGQALDADLRAVDPEFRPHVTRSVLAWGGERAELLLPHPGAHNLMNALAAASVALLRGLSLAAVAERLATAPAPAGRLQFFARADGVIAVIDFAHSPDALERALQVARPLNGRLLVVFGCPGEGDRGKRPAMGELAGRLADWIVLTSDNPKHEAPEAILDEIEAGLRGSSVGRQRIVDRAEAVRHAVARAEPGDVVLVAGKGHESYQIVGDAFLPYSDRAVLEEAGFSEVRPALT